jgi:ubiquinone/menaquinone biosynthesis C-methylase UbiE
LGCGTGSLTKFLVKLLPEAKFTCVDLSEAYLWKARKNLENFTSVDFLQADAAKLPFDDQAYDVVVSCFLFHELPEAERLKVFQQSRRVLRPGGFMGLVDSLQLGDQVKLDFALKRFPMSFHEPFYKNYIQIPLEKQIASQGFVNLVTETGYFSKVVSAQNP